VLRKSIHTGSKYDVTVLTASLPFLEPHSYSWLHPCQGFCQLHPSQRSSVVSDATGVQLFFLARAVSASGAVRGFCAALPPPFAFCGILSPRHSIFSFFRPLGRLVTVIQVRETHGVLGKVILDFYSVKCLVRGIVGRIGNLGETR